MQEQHGLPATKGINEMHTAQIVQYGLLCYIAAFAVYQIASAAWWLLKRLWRS